MGAIRYGWIGGMVIVLLLTFGAPGHAVPVTISDPYLQPPNNCGNASCDVIGLQVDFDIQKIVFTSLTSGNVTANIYFNYHAGAQSLASWLDFGINLSVGDLIFKSGADTYVVPLHNHGLFLAGQLYSVTQLMTAQQVLGNPGGVIYRNGEYVWGGGTPTALGSIGTVSVACASGAAPVGGQCPSAGELIASLTFDPDNSFWNHLSTTGMSVHFASATCGNDVIDGNLAPVPEPGTLLLLGSGLVGMAAFARRRLARK